ncbi:site-specific DNA-methyltransferase [Aestuariibacter sp. GS-14]|uniref:DNA methyltransferase n=1 Tax=Aestuariibacter sp. GS-14 TaxID=2590670 RepID=UPI00112C8997|nr:DNA methyltransferase [Aestuariibacter sp. GS-14]TPV55766.1 site-specific DNA-methyltransferase [Aestuariibacter sp. GS-14]
MLENDVAAKDLSLVIKSELNKNGLVILPPMDVSTSFELVSTNVGDIDVCMLDPWYNKGIGGVRDDYNEFVMSLLTKASRISQHVFLWGFPEIVANFVSRIPSPLEYNCWLTWYYKNNPSVIRGWRSAQQTCLHLSRSEAQIFLEPFLTEKQLQKKEEGKLRYIPGPPSVIEAALNIGFIGRNEQTGHPAQKPEKVYDTLFKMTANSESLVFDPMAGSGTTGAIANKNGFKAILCDHNPDYIELMEKRLGLKRVSL